MGALEVAAGSSEVVLVVEHDAQAVKDAAHPVVVTVHGLQDIQGALQVRAGAAVIGRRAPWSTLRTRVIRPRRLSSREVLDVTRQR